MQPSQAIDFEHIARAALALASVPADLQEKVVTELYSRLDKTKARARRDELIRKAYRAIGEEPGSMRVLAGAIREYRARIWPRTRYFVQPPPDHHLMHRIFFSICRTAADADICIPDEKQVRRICGHSAGPMSRHVGQHEGSTNNTGTES